MGTRSAFHPVSGGGYTDPSHSRVVGRRKRKSRCARPGGFSEEIAVHGGAQLPPNIWDKVYRTLGPLWGEEKMLWRDLGALGGVYFGLESGYGVTLPPGV